MLLLSFMPESSEGMSIKEQCRKTCNYCGKYSAKMDDHSGEELIANMVSASEPKEDDKSVFQEKPKLMITKCVNAMHRQARPCILQAAIDIMLLFLPQTRR